VPGARPTVVYATHIFALASHKRETVKSLICQDPPWTRASHVSSSKSTTATDASLPSSNTYFPGPKSEMRCI
jgi:hypothetical protein